MKPNVHSLFPSIDEVPEFFRTYVDAIGPFEDPIQVLDEELKRQFSLLDNCPGLDLNYSYAHGKWTLRQVIVHMIDAEMVMCFRLLAAIRKDGNNYPGYDHENYAVNTVGDQRNWMELRTFWKNVRKQTSMFCHEVDEESWNNSCTIDGNSISAALLLYIIIGHPRVHFDTIRKRYIP
jgi:hypothetical protein